MLENAQYIGLYDMPVLQGTNAIPEKLVAFSDAMKPSWTDYDCWVHFFEDDDNINRFWNNPLAYINKLSKFQGIIGLDYSVGWDLPFPVKINNHFRNSVCTYWLQRQGLTVIPQGRCEPDDYEETLAGFPRHSTIAIGARSMVRDCHDRQMLKASVKHIVDFLEPSCLVWYGSTQYEVTDYPLSKEIPVKAFPGKGRGELSHRDEKEAG